jgi:phage tail-like protein
MDANGLRLWAFHERRDWRLSSAGRDLQYDDAKRLLKLANQQAAPAPAEDAIRARALATQPSMARDAMGTWAFWDSATATIRAAGAGAASTPIVFPQDTPVGTPTPTDMALGADDVLYVARNGGVWLIDRRDRWQPARVAADNFTADRLAPAPGGGVWLLDRTRGLLARLLGQLLRDLPALPKNSDVFVPVEPNPDPPRLAVHRNHPLPPGHEGMALACSGGGQVAVLAWRSGETAVLFLWQNHDLVRQFALAGLRNPISLAFVDETRVAVLATDAAHLAPQAFAYDITLPPSDTADALPVGDVYPLVAAWDAGFANAPGAPPRYPVFALTPARPDAARPAEPVGMRPLQRLSLAARARTGSVMLGPLDGGHAGASWHRLYLEAALPEHAGIRVWCHAAETAATPAPPGAAAAPDWHLHVFGAPASQADIPDAPLGAWLDQASELPFSPGLLPCPAETQLTGLFTALIQRAGRRVRLLRGRYLWLHVELIGDSRASPEVAGLRVHGSRFSYRDRYLPSLYQETLFGADADAAGGATPPDFLDRFLGLFEGGLTQLEDKVAGSWLLTDPAAAPPEALAWLGKWIGIALDVATDPMRQRQILLAAPFTARLYGTLGGLIAALELATGGFMVRGGQIDVTRRVPRPGQLALASLNDQVVNALVLSVAEPGSGGETAVLVGGAVTRGILVVAEGFRLRRTFATILGADLADTANPLTLGLAHSGNSFVGDTLFLGREQQRAFLSLFSADLLMSRRDRAAVARFLDALAYRVLVLVHDAVVPQDYAHLSRIADAAAPAHVETLVQRATRSLIVGVASLVGVDTYLVATSPPGTVRLNRSWLGIRDLLTGIGLLDARGEAPASARPVAVIDGPLSANPTIGFLLSGSRSQAAPGRQIERYVWTWQ